MMTVGLSDGVSVDDRSDGMVNSSERMDGVLPRGLVMLTMQSALIMKMVAWAEEFVPVKSVKQRKSHYLPLGENLPLSGQMTYASLMLSEGVLPVLAVR